MLKRWQSRPAGWLAAAGTLAAMAAIMVVAAPGGATTPEKQYPSSFTMSCVIAPGSLNSEETIAGEMRFSGPESVTEGESAIEFSDASITLTAPAELSNALRADEVRKLRGKLKNLTIDASGLEPIELNLPALAYEAPVEENKPLVLVFPHEGTFSFGPYKVTGKAGEDATLSLASKPGYKEVGGGSYEATGAGITFTLEGLNEGGTSIIGPLTVACNPPSGALLAQIPIEQGTTGTATTSSGTTQSTTTCTETTDFPHPLTLEPNHGPSSGGTTVTITGFGAEPTEVVFPSTKVSFEDRAGSISIVTPPGTGTVRFEVRGPVTACENARYIGVGSFTYESPVEKAEYHNWVLSGSLTDKKLSQAITLPEGATFNGSGEVNTETGAGSVKGNLAVPPFTTALKLFGVLPVNLGLTVTQVGSLEGTIAKSETVSGDETLSAPVKLDLGITSVSLLGLKIPTTCTTAEPLALNLVDNLTREELLSKGWSFSGITTIPKVKCEGGFLGAPFGVVLSLLLSGPENPYAIKISAPDG
jgi:hypothetical protein